MNISERLKYVVPSCQDILLFSESTILDGSGSVSTKDVDYEDI